ncbi:putative glycosidase C21B10,07 OS=Schizosaccharomyces pombe (strain 972 / ATCC 24843) GN=SPBC21B10.07 PE=3 SV=1 [Rhizoctonia solani AG-1 IB]|uniref:Putative glycosidase C21B10,07 n=1 Tax=Thanatephorus cucumeris (strain AG1-IB / isolate 7/3/14) TaxID=1108050 RepID=A0A0B7FL64_THACB|nr:putative glycosidase C21B10,07 OS=Schizosaccharomyces pombe (strain 972 / ATCC 24843) GN=SPBC21B10.07 PE=3 SV=1 [Rhizoctonia solani AG-1 IB]
MRPFAVLAFAGIAAAQLPAFGDSLNIVDTFMHDLQITFHEITGTHPRRSFHKRAPGKLAKRCIRRPSSGYPGPGGNTTTTTRSVSGSTSSTRTSTRTTTRSTSISSSTRTSSSTSTSTTSAPAPSSTWTLQTRMEGSTFFDGWEFWAYPDPTNGAVDYQNLDGSSAAGLHEINSDGNAIMRVETTQQVSGNRKSVRLHSHTTYNGGLVILDAVHMPYGCGTWPAFWSNGPNWPNGGEIDIVEGVNDYQTNQASLHTKAGCTIPQEYGSSGTLAASLNCAAHETGNQGCGQLNSKPNNYGKAFNDNGGGVYAMKWDRSGISIYFFPRNEIPSDIKNEAPRPDRWGTPVGNWPAQSCDPFEFMSDHIMIFDTTLCGDWAGNAWHSSGIAGQAQTCAAMTGYNTCLDYIRNEGANLKDAFWEVKSVKLYK